MAKIFGDEVAVYEADLHVDHTTHELVVEEHGVPDGGHVQRIATEAGVFQHRGSDVEKGSAGKGGSFRHQSA